MTHGVIFHYFWNDEIRQTQGAINERQFRKIIDKCSRECSLLCAEDYYQKAISGKLCEKDVCLTFDDGLSCQYEVAEPILREIGLTAFFFVYTSPMEGVAEKIEIYRAFRNSYPSIDEFYSDFFDYMVKDGKREDIDYTSMLNTSEAKSYYKDYDYYSDDDRLFRYARDVLLKEKYDDLINNMMHRNKFDIANESKAIWISREDLKRLRSRGNIIGLHSHTHPTALSDFKYEEKLHEYNTNKTFLNGIVDEVYTASYPCDSYDKDSRKVLEELGIKIAFIARMKEKDDKDMMRIARIDASYLL